MPSALNIIKDATEFRELRKLTRDFVDEADAIAEDALGEREATANFAEDSSFETKANKLVKSSDVIAALNLMAAHFAVRVWPEFLLAKLKEYAVGKIAGAAARTAATNIAINSGQKAVSGAVGAIVGAGATSEVQAAEMKALEKEIRAATSKVRRELNEAALPKVKKPSRMGPTFVRYVS